MILTEACHVAQNIVTVLRPICERIEIVAVPKFQTDMFGGTMLDHSLDMFNWSTVGVLVEGKHKLKKVDLRAGIRLDLFIVTPPAQWGVQMVIRTGPSEFSQWMVTKKCFGGALPDSCYVKDGAVWDGVDGSKYNLPEERDFFRLCGLKWVEPALREAKWQK